MSHLYYLYCVESDHTNTKGAKKLGMTGNPVHRMCVYNTGDCPDADMDKRFESIWELNTTNSADSLNVESILKQHFNDKRRIRKNGNYSEWFTLTLQDVREFLIEQPFIVRELSIDEIALIHQKSEHPSLNGETDEIKEEEELIKIQNSIIRTPPVIPTLKEEFFSTFIPEGSLPRRIQLELWDNFESICKTEQKYRGIIQWATGAGKTIAFLMLFVLASEKYKKEGTIFRGIIISPRNDIFDTIIHHIRKLSKWGITVCEGHNAKLSSLHIPRDRHVLITSTHASLSDNAIWESLPNISMIHYDEVHRITGTEFFNSLKEKIIEWETQYLTGTSATPKTCSQKQNGKIGELFGTPLNILHKCNVDEAIIEGWIAPPRFSVHVMPKDSNRTEQIAGFIRIISQSVTSKKEKQQWKAGKMIAYLSSRQDVYDAIEIAKAYLPDATIYTAVEEGDAKSSDQFITDNADGTLRILFACDRFREGSDICGIEMTVTLMGNAMGAHIILQIAGRALRNDYPGKEGWCVIVRPSEEGVTESDVFESIVLQIMDLIDDDTNDSSSVSSVQIRKMVERFFGNVEISGKVFDIEETVKRIQSLYAREAFKRVPPKEQYEVVRALNKEMNIQSRNEYEERKLEHPKFIDKPSSYFKDYWVSWYHFLGVDTSGFPQTKPEWIRVCKDSGFLTWNDYKTKHGGGLPDEPGQMFNDYTNWDAEMGISSEVHVW